MEFNDKKIKKLIQDNQHQLPPPELNWDEMKDGIFDKIYSIEMEEQSSQKKKEPKRKIIFFILLLLGAGLGFFTISYPFNQANRAKTPEAIIKGTEISHPPREKTQYDTSEYCPESIEVQESEIETENQSDAVRQEGTNDYPIATTADDKSAIQGGDQKVTRSRKKASQKTVEATDRTISSHTPEDTDRNGNGNFINGSSDTTIQDKTVSTGKYLNTDQTNNITNTGVYVQNVSPQPFWEINQDTVSPWAELGKPNNHQNIPKLNTTLYTIDRNSTIQPIRTIPINQHATSAEISENSRKEFSNQLIFEGGISFWNTGYGPSKPERAHYEKTQTSFQIQGQYSKSLNRGYFVMAGLQYQQLESKFQYKQTLQNYTITLYDTIIQVQNNSLTGSQNIIRGDVDVTVQAERRIVHYNTSRLLRASLSMGRSWKFSVFQTDLYLGASTNAWAQNQGRTFYQGDIINYSGTSNALFRNVWATDAVMGGRFQYFVLENLGITAGCQFQKSLVNWSDEDSIKFYPSAFSCQLGLSYSWK